MNNRTNIFCCLIFAILLFANSNVAKAEPVPQDTIPTNVYTYKYPGTAGAWQQEFSFEGVPFLIAGALMFTQKDEWQNVRHTVMPGFRTTFDDYMQYSPLGLTAILKACGVKTRSNWWRFLASSAFSAVTTTAIVNSIKYSVKEMRPDGSRRNSFPSGHTSTAFMAATIMHKELGARSPWYSIGAYTVATATGLMRMMNNRHWINDIIFGAGVGITSVNLGYFISDVIFKDYGIDGRYTGFNQRAELTGNPSFLSIGMNIGAATNLKSPQFYSCYNGTTPAADATAMNLKLRTGVTTALTAEGAYFFNRYIGVGGQIRATVASLDADYNTLFEPHIYNCEGKRITYMLKDIATTSFGAIDANIGPYASLPLAPRIRLDCKAMIGYRIIGAYNFTATYSLSDEGRQNLIQERVNNNITEEEYNRLNADIINKRFIEAADSYSLNMNTGAGVTFAILRNTVARAYIDYTFSAPKIKYTINNSGTLSEDANFNIADKGYSTTLKTPMHNFSLGLSICTTFDK